MPNAGLISLTKLLRRMIYSFILTVVGCWGLIIPRLNLISQQKSLMSPDFWLYLDLGSLALALIGIFMILYYKHLLLPRLERLETLGESKW
jgi:hypothetical protein